MVRIKKGVTALKTRRNILKAAKGFRNGRKNKEKLAYEQLYHSYASAFAHRRDKKGDFRRLWNVRINAAIRPHGLSYSKFIGALKQKGIAVDRKILADLAQNAPAAFERIVAQVK
ncbi:MAG: ribosomal protein large subunit ribosomal protein [Candidatus Parcubacteria bacterium]|jgi:large subunit ribosomal protein L20